MHYKLRASTRSQAKAGKVVAEMRRLAAELPFESVGEVKHFRPAEISEEVRGEDETLRWALLQCGKSVAYPWSKKGDRMGITTRVEPEEVFLLTIEPGPGSEPANIGLARYPKTVELTYRPQDDARFWTGDYSADFDYRLWARFIEKKRGRYLSPGTPELCVPRAVRTGLSGWRWGSFCKTERASDPDCGGAANFLRCHVSLIALLDRISELPGMAVDTYDEGDYGSPDATYSIPVLLDRLQSSSEMIAAFAGALKDACGGGVESPILGRPDFEQLEFRGSRRNDVDGFLKALSPLLAAAASEVG